MGSGLLSTASVCRILLRANRRVYQQMIGRVAGKVAFITGGASGFGRQCAVRLAEQGASLVVTDIDEAGARETVELVGGETLVCRLDVVEDRQWHQVMERALERFGQVDVVVNSAGVGFATDNIENISDETWDTVIDINLTGTFLGCQHAVRVMKQNNGGSIINLSSVLGIRGDAESLAYCASKGGVRLLTKSVAVHCGEQGLGIRCNSIHPGYMRTPMVQAWFDGLEDSSEVERRLIARHPIGRLGDADDIAHMIVYLASDESRFVTGAEMVVDGGFTAI